MDKETDVFLCPEVFHRISVREAPSSHVKIFVVSPAEWGGLIHAQSDFMFMDNL